MAKAITQERPHHRFVIAPLWDSKSGPPADNVGSTRTGTAANHPHLDETPIPPRHLNDGRDMGDDLQLRLQMAMTSLTRAESTASNTLKRYQDTADAIIKNMKA